MKLLKMFGGSDDSGKKARGSEFDEEKHLELLDDDYFAVDNGIDKLEIFELGITETKDPARSMASAPLQDKVHLKSEISESEALELKKAKAEAIFAEIERQEQINRSYEESERKGKKKNVVYDYDLDETEFCDADAKEEARTEEEPKKTVLDPKITSADAVFASDFDPFKLVMSDEMANKPSSKSIALEKETKVSRSYSGSLSGDISHITEEDIMRARKQEEFERKKEERIREFERRKAQLVSNATHAAEPKKETEEEAPATENAEQIGTQSSAPSAESPVTNEAVSSEAEATAKKDISSDASCATDGAVNAEAEQEVEAPSPAEKPGRSYFNPMYAAEPIATASQNANDDGANVPFKRAAAFSAMTMNKAKAESENNEGVFEKSDAGEEAAAPREAKPLAYTFEIVEGEHNVEEFVFDGDETPDGEDESTARTEENAKDVSSENEADARVEEAREEQVPTPHSESAADGEGQSPISLFERNDAQSAPDEREASAESEEQAVEAAENDAPDCQRDAIEDEYPERPIADEHYETINEAGIPIIDRGVPLREIYGKTEAPKESKKAEEAESAPAAEAKIEEKAATNEVEADAEEGGLVFEFDSMRPTPPANGGPRTVITERIVYDAEAEAEEKGEQMQEYADEAPDVEACESDSDAPREEDAVAVEADDEGWGEKEIPPEKQNPEVARMRDMFTALRGKDSDAEDDSEADGEELLEEDIPYFDTFLDDPTDDDESDEFAYAEEDVFVQADDESDTNAQDEAELPPFEVNIPEKKAEEPIKKKPDFSNYKKPPIELLGLERPLDDEEINAEIQENIRIIIETLASFNVTASIKGVDRGPRITRYEVVPARGVKVQAITHLFDDITLNLAVEGIRMEAPIPGKSAIGIEIPNKHSANVRLRELLECDEFTNAKSTTFVCIGKDVAGNPVFGDIAKFPHALVAGATGMGKSVSINAIMISMLYKSRPDQVKFIMIDPKKVEFRMYSGIPHLLIPVITEAKQAAGALMWAVEEMERRYDLIEKLNIRNIEAYNERQAVDPSIGEHMPKIIIVIDELNDLMMQVRDPVEDLIMRIAQKARAAGIHLIIGTQRPDVKVITGTIKANINTRISCKVTSVVDSRTILEMAGAEKLLNRGDMLFKPVDKTKPIRVQGAFVSDSEVENIMNFLKEQMNGEQYDEEIFAEINKAAQKCGNKKNSGASADDFGADDEDDCGYYGDQKFLDAVELAIRSGKISTALLQRKLSIGYGRAAKYIDHMEEIGVVSEPNGSKAREVYLTMDEWREKLSRVNCD